MIQNLFKKKMNAAFFLIALVISMALFVLYLFPVEPVANFMQVAGDGDVIFSCVEQMPVIPFEPEPQVGDRFSLFSTAAECEKYRSRFCEGSCKIAQDAYNTIRGDANQDCQLDMGDSITILQASLGSSVNLDFDERLCIRKIGDVNCDNRFDFADAIWLLTRGKPACEPYPKEGYITCEPYYYCKK